MSWLKKDPFPVVWAEQDERSSMWDYVWDAVLIGVVFVGIAWISAIINIFENN